MAWDYGRCVSVLNKEITLIKQIALVQEGVRQAIMAKEWADFDTKMTRINELGEEFGLLERERMEVFAALQEKFPQNPSMQGQGPSFYSLAAKLPPKERRELSRLYRELKMETLRMKALNETFSTYLKEVKIMATAWLDAVYPAQGGKLYTRKGRQISGDPRSMVLNQHM